MVPNATHLVATKQRSESSRAVNHEVWCTGAISPVMSDLCGLSRKAMMSSCLLCSHSRKHCTTCAPPRRAADVAGGFLRSGLMHPCTHEGHGQCV